MTPLRVVVAEDHLLVREGVVSLLTSLGDIDVVAQVGDATALLQAVAELTPDVVLTDIRMPPGNATDGIEAALRIRREWPGTGVVVLSQHLDEAYVRALFADGAQGLGYLLKERIGERDVLADALHRAAAGESVLDRTVVDVLVSGGGEAGPVARLSSRERDVLALMAEGHGNAAVAGRLHVSLSSVEKHVSAIFAKLDLNEDADVHRRVAAVLAWLRQQ